MKLEINIVISLSSRPKCDEESQREIQEISNDAQTTVSDKRIPQEQEYKKTDHSEEQITSRTIYDEQILCKEHLELELVI